MARKISLVIWILCASQCVAYQAFEIKSNSADVPVLNLTGVRNRAKRGISGSTLTYTERVEFLNKHNEFRGTVNPSASDMKFMVWHEELAKMAQEWADTCNFDHGQPTRASPPFTYIGQNLYASTAQTVTPTKAVTSWDTEKLDYTYATKACSDVCGHYTQVVWANSDNLGCAKAQCATLAGTTWTSSSTIVVCNYGPAGNFNNAFPYTQGTSCAACASGETCSSNICVPNPRCGSKACTNGGTLDTTSCECDCVSGYNDPLCATADCSTTCENGGTLVTASCTCDCPAGYGGSTCSTSQCTLACENGGTLDSTACTCSCVTGYSGNTCSDVGSGTDNNGADHVKVDTIGIYVVTCSMILWSRG